MSSLESKKLHICFVTKNAPTSTGPNEQGHILPMARQIVKLGHHVTILTWKSSLAQEKYEEEGITVLFLGEGHYKSIKDFPEVAAAKINELHQATSSIDIVHSLDTPFAKPHLLFKKRSFALSYGVEVTSMTEVFSKFVKTYSGDVSALRNMASGTYLFLKQYLNKDYKILRHADGVFVTSPKQSIALDRYYLYPSMRTYQVPISLATGFFSKKEKSADLLNSLDLDYKSQVIVARHDMEDLGEISFLLGAFERVAVKKPRTHLLIIGDGPFMKEAERRSLELALANRVHFLGQFLRKQYVNYIALGDIFIQLNARTSGMGQSLFEAMAQEKIVIGSEFSPISHFIEDKKQGYLIRPGEKEKLTQLIIKSFEKADETLALGQNARNKIIQNFDRKALASHACQAFYQIIENKR